MSEIILSTIVLIIVLVIMNIVNEPKEQKRERLIIKNKTINPIYLTHIDGLSGYGGGVKIKFSKNEEKITIDGTYSIPTKDIKSATINSSKQLTMHQKDVIGRAVIGGVLLGPLGAVVGGISGVGTQQETKTVWLITIDYKDYENNKTVLFSTDDEFVIPRLKLAMNVY